MKNEFLDHVRRFVSDEQNSLFASLFALVKEKDDQGKSQWSLRKMNLHFETGKRVGLHFHTLLKSLFLEPSSEIVFKGLNDISDRTKDAFITNKSEYDPFSRLFYPKIPELNKNEIPQGFLFKLGPEKEPLWVYQGLYSMERIKKDKRILLYYSENGNSVPLFMDQSHELLIIENKAHAIMAGDDFVILDLNQMQDRFDLRSYIETVCENIMGVIRTKGLLADFGFFNQWIKEDLRRTKRLMKAKTSIVMNIPMKTIIERAAQHPKYKTLIVEQKISVTTGSNADLFIKMLNDDYVYSRLTEAEYDASIKQITTEGEE